MLDALKQIRGAARLVKCAPVAALATAVSDFVRAAREGRCELSPPALDWSRYAVDLLAGALVTDDETFPTWAESAAGAFATATETFARAVVSGRPTAPAPLGSLPGTVSGASRGPGG
ncbi:hypothetical protein [Frigoriglobus tundricola]|uniref:hypothetical protein n=1 Tax=Frigoriglobus tundricola TaxID=2774151 RepID=UPI0036F1AC90